MAEAGEVADVSASTPLRHARLEDRYQLAQGLAYLSGTQALVRVLLNQSARDRAAGRNTGGFVSGYRGSPLALWSAQSLLKAKSSKLPNLFLNAGLGTLGWTHSCGLGKSIAGIVSGLKPEVDFAFTGK